MGKSLKQLVPKSFWIFVKRFYYRIKEYRKNAYWEKRDLTFSQEFKFGSEEATLSGLLVAGHVLEKGITMPARRLGFGIERVRDLIARCQYCIHHFGANSIELQSAIADLRQYRVLHAEAQYELPKDIVENIERLESELKLTDENCYSMTRSEYFSDTKDFKAFAEQRHSVRWFSDIPVDDSILEKAIHLAQTAPSACNRQATRVKIISDPKVKEQICNTFQNGNRGFGHLVDKWLLITQEQGAWSLKYRTSMFIDAGIFTMNLLYALHYYKICAVTLNAHMSVANSKKLQHLLGYPESEVPIVFIALGNAPEKFMIAKSRRLNVEDIIARI
ncbi:MAG: nitroreductase family protein [Bacteroidaceae bacterium]|nr:nitroreductase family protein [Bacteroidaceae bacterium]